ncbi:MAG TPA: helix-turn-helix transcriptional regulator [Gaiellaceae bacterium]|jgi:transcriptional regulator with XRE-family HTH domain|nr:helix-turn-helix transcriptional regulator [Gaiellaceae bacterium]
MTAPPQSDRRTDDPFPIALAALLEESGTSLTELAVLAGIDPAELAPLSDGTKEPPPKAIEKIAPKLGVRPRYFLEYRIAVVVDGLARDPRRANELFYSSLPKAERATVDSDSWDDRSFGEAVRSRLLEKKLTQAKVADAVGLSESVLSQLLGVRRRLDVGLLLRFAEALDLSPESFLAYRVELVAKWLRDNPAELARILEAIERPVELAPYEAWEPRELPDPLEVSLADLARSLIEIVAVEGPVLGARVYRLRLQASGLDSESREHRQALNRASRAAVHAKVLVGVSEQAEPSQKFLILRRAGTPEVSVRERGGRRIVEIPLAEIREVIASIQSRRGRVSVESLHSELAALYDIEQPRESDIEHVNRAITAPGP